jgi:alpha-L-fucosidase
MNKSQEWFRHAGVGMFIHWGIFSVIGRGGWEMHTEKIPLDDYDNYISGFTAANYDPDAWAKLAKQNGMRYMVLGTKHHEGFCLFDTATTNRNAVQQGPKRDLVKGYVEACRRHGLKVGLYFSLPDWSIQAFNDGPEKASKKAWEAFIGLIHEQVRELCANYGKIDVLWYDLACNLNGACPLTVQSLRAHELNAMVRALQPDILINDRSGLPEDFSTAEQQIKAPDDPDRLWEACLTMNKHWGYFPADTHYKSPAEIVHLLTAIASNRGNMLLNVGPKPDGTIVQPERERMEALGRWLTVHREAIENVSPGTVSGGTYGCSAVKGNSVYLYVHWWHGSSITIADCDLDFSSGVILGTNQEVTIHRDGKRIKLLNLPTCAPDPFCSVIRLAIKR